MSSLVSSNLRLTVSSSTIMTVGSVDVNTEKFRASVIANPFSVGRIRLSISLPFQTALTDRC